MKRSILLMVFVGGVILTGCASAPAATPAPTNPPPSPSPAPTPEAKVKIYYEENAQVELISPAGSRVLIDVYSPASLSSPATANDILLTTHTHDDHVKPSFYKSFPGQQLFTEAGVIKLPNVTIQGIASAHNSSDTPRAKNGANYIFLVEMGGLRIAHFGDIGQDTLTADQLAALGQVDIAITQFDNSYSGMNVTNKKGFNLMDQVKPRLIIPTHNSFGAVKIEKEKWPTLYSDQKFVSIGRDDLTGETRLLYLGFSGKKWSEITNAAQVDW